MQAQQPSAFNFADSSSDSDMTKPMDLDGHENLKAFAKGTDRAGLMHNPEA